MDEIKLRTVYHLKRSDKRYGQYISDQCKCRRVIQSSVLKSQI